MGKKPSKKKKKYIMGWNWPVIIFYLLLLLGWIATMLSLSLGKEFVTSFILRCLTTFYVLASIGIIFFCTEFPLDKKIPIEEE